MATPDSDAQLQAKLDLAKEFAHHLAKGIKSIGLYRHNTARFGAFLEGANQALHQYTGQFGALTLKVEAACFALGSEPVFPPDAGSDNLPYRFYRDGVRQLVFRPELTADELTQFVLIAVSDTRNGEDTLSQLWKASFANLEYVVVEGFTVGENSTEEIQVEVDQLVDYLYARLRSDSNDTLGFARLKVEDLDAKLEGIEQIRGAIISGAPVSDELKQKLQWQLADDDAAVLETVLRAIFHSIALGVLDDLELLKEVFAQLLDVLLLQEDYASIALLRTNLKGLGARDPNRAELAAKLDDFLRTKMSEDSRLRQVAGLLQRGVPKQLEQVRAYLGALTPAALAPLLEVLDTVEAPESRQVFVDVLADLGKQAMNPTPFVNRLVSEKSQTVRDMIAVIERCEFPDRHQHYGTALANKNPVVRQEVLALLAQSKSEASRALLANSLTDPSGPVRIQAARSLADCAPEKALTALMRLAKAPDFEKRDLREREALYGALGTTGLPGAFAHFVELLKHSRGLLARRKVTEEKLCAVAGMLALGTVHAFKALQATHDDKSNDEEVRTAARNAMMQLRRQLSTTPGGPAP